MVALLPELGHVQAVTEAGAEFVFVPALSSMAAIGSPKEIVQTFAELHSADARRAMLSARVVIHSCCVEGADSLCDLVGWLDPSGDHPGAMPAYEVIGLAIHLMKHGIIGKASPGEGDGQYCDSFDAVEYISMAVVHLGMSRAEASQLTMTELHYMLEAKFPKNKSKDFNPSAEEYEAAMREADELLARVAGKQNGVQDG
jgi:hypothetical protein